MNRKVYATEAMNLEIVNRIDEPFSDRYVTYVWASRTKAMQCSRVPG